MMTKVESLDKMREKGADDALALREEAAAGLLDGTQIIAREGAVPAYDGQKDYTEWPAGSPVADEGQVWLLLQPHNAAHYESRPSALRALWGLCHTKDPARAKPWVDAYGVSGAYMRDECYLAEDGVVWRAKEDNLVHDAAAYPAGWEKAESA